MQRVEPSTTLHEALVLFLDRLSKARQLATSSCGPEDYAGVALSHRTPSVQAGMTDATARPGAPLKRLLSDILQVWTDAARNPRAWTPKQ